MATRQQSGWVTEIPVISTRHMPMDAAEALRKCDMVAEYGYGFFIFTGPPDNDMPLGLPDWMGEVCRWLWANHPGSTWVCFDADGDFLPGLKHYDWI